MYIIYLILQIAEGTFRAHISLIKQLDFETRSAYIMTLKASDGASSPLTAFASVAIDVLDVQDQPPVFLNSPYSATVAENTASVRNDVFLLPKVLN